MKYILTLCSLLMMFCSPAQETSFSAEALSDVFIAEDNTEVAFSEILEQHVGSTILIDVWAGWCKDCIIGMPKVKELQKNHNEVVFVFLSLDKTTTSWKKAMETFEVVGENYYISSGWKGPFCSGIDLDWIPRYMVVNPEGEISVFKAIKADDKRLKAALLNNDKQ